MNIKLIPLNITIADTRLAGFRFAAKHFKVALEELLAYRLIGEVSCLQECGTLQSLDRMEQARASGDRTAFEIDVNEEIQAIIKRISQLLNRDHRAFCGELLDYAGDLISSQVGSFLEGEESDGWLMDTRRDVVNFTKDMTIGDARFDNKSDLWDELMISRDFARSQKCPPAQPDARQSPPPIQTLP